MQSDVPDAESHLVPAIELGPLLLAAESDRTSRAFGIHVRSVSDGL